MNVPLEITLLFKSYYEVLYAAGTVQNNTADAVPA